MKNISKIIGLAYHRPGLNLCGQMIQYCSWKPIILCWLHTSQYLGIITKETTVGSDGGRPGQNHSRKGFVKCYQILRSKLHCIPLIMIRDPIQIDHSEDVMGQMSPMIASQGSITDACSCTNPQHHRCWATLSDTWLRSGRLVVHIPT